MGSLLTGVQTEISVGFSVSGTSQQEDTLAGRSQLSKLVESVGSSLGCMDSVLGSLGESKSTDSESFRHLEESGVVGDRADDSNDSAVELGFALSDLSFAVGEVLDDPGDGDREAGETRLVESFVDNFIELGVSPASHEGVELNGFIVTLINDCK